MALGGWDGGTECLRQGLAHRGTALAQTGSLILDNTNTHAPRVWASPLTPLRPPIGWRTCARGWSAAVEFTTTNNMTWRETSIRQSCKLPCRSAHLTASQLSHGSGDSNGDSDRDFFGLGTGLENSAWSSKPTQTWYHFFCMGCGVSLESQVRRSNWNATTATTNHRSLATLAGR